MTQVRSQFFLGVVVVTLITGLNPSVLIGMTGMLSMSTLKMTQVMPKLMLK